MRDENFQKVVRLCDYYSKTADPKMKWMWGEALFGYSLYLLDKHMGEERYTKFLTDYCDYYVANEPRVDYADTAAPALITYSMYKKTNNSDYKKLTDKVLDYIRFEPRLIGDAVNHLGKSPEGKFYPKSIWVDSLMMFSVFPALYASENADAELLDYAARQPEIYAGYMQDKEQKLWYHSYWVKAARPHPQNGVFWGRGNGWVVASLPMILDCIGIDHPKASGILQIYRETVNAVLKHALPDGSFTTVLGKKSYRELSATALIAAGILHGVRCGYLDNSYKEAGIKAFLAVTDSFIEQDGAVYMPQISAPTIPLHIFPLLCYRLTPRGKNWTYGMAAAVFAAIEYGHSDFSFPS